MENPVQPPTKPERNWKKILLFLLIGLFLISLVGVGLYLLVPKPTEESTPTTQPQKQATPSAPKDETADWKTFTGKTRESDPAFTPTKTIRFSFRYPADFRLLGDVGGIIVSNDPTRKNGFDPLVTPGSLSVFARTSTDAEKPSSPTETSLGGRKAIRGTKSSGKIVTATYYVSSVATEEGDSVPFALLCQYILKEGVDTAETCDLMALTFKFLD